MTNFKTKDNEEFLLFYSTEYITLKAYELIKEEILYARVNCVIHRCELGGEMVFVGNYKTITKVTEPMPVFFEAENKLKVAKDNLWYVDENSSRYYFDEHKVLRAIADITITGLYLRVKIEGDLKTDNLVIKTDKYVYKFVPNEKREGEYVRTKKNRIFDIIPFTETTTFYPANYGLSLDDDPYIDYTVGLHIVKLVNTRTRTISSYIPKVTIDFTDNGYFDVKITTKDNPHSMFNAFLPKIEGKKYDD